MNALFEILEELEVVAETGTGEARNSPLGIGRIGQVGDYEISVISVTPNANDLVLGANQFNEPPMEGNQFFMVRIAVTYVGSASGNPSYELNPQAVGELSVGYTTFNNMCGYNDYPDNLIMATELFNGGSGEYNVCWQIDSDDQDSLVMYIESNVAYDANPVWFSLGNPIEVTIDPDATAIAEETAMPTATATVQPTAPSAEAENSTNSNSRDTPAPIGQATRVGDYEVEVVAVTPNANDIVLNHNQFNEPPAEGMQYFMVRIAVTYVGNSTGNPSFDLDYQSVGNLNNSYTIYNNMCGFGDYPDALILATELFQGGSGEYNICWQIKAEDQDSLLMYIEPILQYNADPVWFSLQP